ncbi:Calponin y domain-containing protein 2 [Lonchura striata]|uniref:Calponin y domain-containing protein 2 n=1 Tax=Lonchura striata TaxID=40157 RepID=A0A218VCR4_9PASE|nr:Calponin y domain-containing protein 2 [Lonchura striata domestica]
MFLHLNGQPIQGIAASQPLPRDPVERMFQLHWQHSELLCFLKSKGAYLSHVMPEFLLAPEDYELWTEVNTGLRVGRFGDFSLFNKAHVLSFSPLNTSGSSWWTMSVLTVVTVLDCITLSTCMRLMKRGSMRSSGNLSGNRIFVLENRTFETMSKRAWTDVLLQMYKVNCRFHALKHFLSFQVFVLPRVSSRMVPDPLSLESLQNMPGIKSEPLCSNIYSRYERTILIWLNKYYEKNRKIVWKDSQRGEIILSLCSFF